MFSLGFGTLIVDCLDDEKRAFEDKHHHVSERHSQTQIAPYAT